MEYVVDEHKNLMPFVMPDIKQFDINWTDETPLYDSSSNATNNPIPLEVNQGVVTATIVSGGYKWVGVPKGNFLILAFSGTYLDVLRDESSTAYVGYYPLFEMNPNNDPLGVKLSPQIIATAFDGGMNYVVLSQTRCLILRMA